jgi:hypothetical protein
MLIVVRAGDFLDIDNQALLHNSLIPSLYLSVYIFIATNMLYNDAFITNSLVML